MKLLTHCRRLAAPLIAALTLAAGGAHAGQSPTLIESNGILMGATGVLVKGTLYDVRFVDGSCNSLFNNCDTSPFIFQSIGAANNAAYALSSQVFNGDWDTHPERTNGCSDASRCRVVTMSANVVGDHLQLSAAFVNSVLDDLGAFEFRAYAATADTTWFTDETIAVWSLHQDTANNVPEPTSLGLMAAALGVLAGTRRRRARAA